MDGPAQQRLSILNHLAAGELTIEEAATILKLSTRQVRRLDERLHREGAAALMHGNRGRRPVNRIDEAERERLTGRLAVPRPWLFMGPRHPSRYPHTQ